VLAAAFFATEDVRRQLAELRDVAAKVDQLYELLTEPEAEQRSGAAVVLRGGSTYHRASCRLVAGKSARAATEEELSRLRPCRAGVIAVTEVLALELAADKILVNAIAPGPIVAPEGTSAEEIEKIERSTPLGRWGGEIEIAKAVLALIDTDFITGETIRVDGGRHIK